MKIVVFGPERRVGVLRGELVVDLSLAYAKYLRERQNERQAVLLAAALVPGDLATFIEAGKRALDHAQTALEYLFGEAFDQLGVNSETLVHKASEVLGYSATTSLDTMLDEVIPWIVDAVEAGTI